MERIQKMCALKDPGGDTERNKREGSRLTISLGSQVIEYWPGSWFGEVKRGSLRSSSLCVGLVSRKKNQIHLHAGRGRGLNFSSRNVSRVGPFRCLILERDRHRFDERFQILKARSSLTYCVFRKRVRGLPGMEEG